MKPTSPNQALQRTRLRAHMHMIRLLPDRLSVQTPQGSEYGISWPDVYRVHAYRLDGITETYRVVCFDFDYGHFIEVNEGMGGFEELLSHLGEYLPLPADYKQQIDATQCHADPTTLYRRS